MLPRAGLVSAVVVALFVVPVATASAKPRSFTVIGVESPGGSATVSGETLFAGTHKVGHDRTVCTPGRVTACRTTFFLQTGTIQTPDAEATNGSTFTLRLVKGTGSYRGAKGTVTVHVLDSTHERESFKFT
jgi:hypothetical protein